MNKTASVSIMNDMQKILDSSSFKSLFKSPFVSTASEEVDVNDAATKFTPSMADDKKQDEEDCGDEMYADDKEDEQASAKETLAFDLALENLLQASSALEHAGFVKGAAVSLKLAGLVVEAKKKAKEDKKDKVKEKADKEAAKEKAAKEKEAKKAKEVKAKEDEQKAKDKKLVKEKAEKEKAAKEKAKEKAAKEKEKFFAKK